MEKVSFSKKLKISRIVLGFWRLMDWKMTTRELENFANEAISMDVTTFDHADIYGDYGCEAEFGKILQSNPALRHKMQLITKCGIKLTSNNFPDRTLNHYDTSYNHILESVEKSLRNFNTDYIDLLLIHRPDPLMDPEETARAFHTLENAGKVLNFGVSNFNPSQFEMLNKYFDGKLVTNQVEISPYCLEHFENGNIEFFSREKIYPMAWSPLAGGKLFEPKDDKSVRLNKKLKDIAIKMDITHIDQVIYAWILNHPVQIIPVTGSGKIERLQHAVDSLDIKMAREDWFDILVASQGYPVP